MADADLVVVMLDGSEELTDEDREIAAGVQDLNHLIVINKIDKSSAEKIEALKEDRLYQRSKIEDLRSFPFPPKPAKAWTSCKRPLSNPSRPVTSRAPVFSYRTPGTTTFCSAPGSEIEKSLDLLEQRMSEEIVLIGLHNSLRYLGQITGETTTEDMLTRIFSTFCIGK